MGLLLSSSGSYVLINAAGDRLIVTTDAAPGSGTAVYVTLDALRTWVITKEQRIVQADIRVLGDLSPLDVYWPISDAPGTASYLDATGYTWEVQVGERLRPAATVPGDWPSTDVESAVGGESTPSLTINFTDANLGALAADTWYVLELIGTGTGLATVRRQIAIRLDASYG